VYGRQLDPLLEALIARGDQHPRFDGPFHERALWRGSLAAWLERTPEPVVRAGSVPVPEPQPA
jgi:hypothetical protein